MMPYKEIFILCFQIIVLLSKYTSGCQNITTDELIPKQSHKKSTDHLNSTQVKSIHGYQTEDRKEIYKEDVIFFPDQAEDRKEIYEEDVIFVPDQAEDRKEIYEEDVIFVHYINLAEMKSEHNSVYQEYRQEKYTEYIIFFPDQAEDRKEIYEEDVIFVRCCEISDCQNAWYWKALTLIAMNWLFVYHVLVVFEIFGRSIFGSSDRLLTLKWVTSVIIGTFILIELYFQRLEMIELFVRTALSKSGVSEEEHIEGNLWIFFLGKPDDFFALAKILLMSIFHVGLTENGTHKYGTWTNEILSYSQTLKITTKETRQYQPQKIEEEAVRHCGLCVNHTQAVAFCKTCKLYICFSCNNLHKRVWTFMNHDVYPFHHNDESQLN